MGTQYRKSIKVEINFTARELKAIRRLYGFNDGLDASTSQVAQFVQDEIDQSKRQVLDDFFVDGGKQSPTFSGRDIIWKGEGYYTYGAISEKWEKVQSGFEKRLENAGRKVVFLEEADISR
jgi:hypothetical protein